MTLNAVEQHIFKRISDKQSCYSFTKYSCKFQECVTESCTFIKRSEIFRQNLLKVPLKELNL